MPKVAIDCDGVLARFDAAFAEIANKLWPGILPVNWEQDETGPAGALGEARVQKVWARINATDNFWLGMNPYADNVGAFARWLIMSRDQDVYIVTSRTPTAGMTVTRQTEWWIRSCGIYPVNNYIGVIVAPEADKKAELYDSMGFDYSVDDKGETVEQCDDVPNHKAYLLDRPWNQDAKVKRRVKSLDAFLKEIKP